MRLILICIVLFSCSVFSEENNWLDDLSRQANSFEPPIISIDSSPKYFQEKFNPFNGAYLIDVFSIDTPGNFPLFSKLTLTHNPIYRYYDSDPDMRVISELSIPRIHGRVTFHGNQPWSEKSKRLCTYEVPEVDLPHRERYGPFVILDDGVEDVLIKKDLNNNKYPEAVFYTKNNSKVFCKSNNQGVEYFVVNDSLGNEYTFDRLHYKKDSSGSRKYLNYTFLPSKIEDKFGNKVELYYDIEPVTEKYSNIKGTINRISWSDGRELLIEGTGRQPISTYNIHYGGKTWSVGAFGGKDFRDFTLPNNEQLRIEYEDVYFFTGWDYEYKYILPDNSYIKYETAYMVGCGPYISSEDNEEVLSFDDDEAQIHYCKVPYSETSPFYSANKTHTWIDKRHFPTLKRKTVSAKGREDAVFTYNFTNGLLDLRASNTLVSKNHERRTLEVIGPDNIKVYVHNPSFNHKEGELIEYSVLDINNRRVLQQQLYNYEYYVMDGYACGRRGCIESKYVDGKKNWDKYHFKRLRSSERIVSENTNYNFEVILRDTFDNETVVKEFISDGGVKYSKFEYANFTNLWSLSNVKSIAVSYDGLSWKNIKSFEYFPENSVYKSSLKNEHVYGKLYKNYVSYHSDGNLKKTTHNGSNNYKQFDDYYRGKARKITVPCATTNGCNTVNNSTTNTAIAKFEVNNDGAIKSVTDFNGNKVSYSYNHIGWLTNIDYADNRWIDKNISYNYVTSANDGIPDSDIIVGQVKQTITQGNLEQVIYYDGLMQPTFTRARDKTNNDTIRYLRTRYDSDNRPILQSFPSNNASSNMGIFTEYDAVGRVISITRQSDGATSTIEYLNDNKLQFTDANGNATKTSYLAYSSPSYDKPTLIEAPNTDDTVIDYNQFGQITSISQGNVTEKRLYDSYQQLCKMSRPEAGVTAYDYNVQRKPIWYAEGTNGGMNNCTTSSVPATHKVLLNYDNLDQLRTENFPDMTPDNVYHYDTNGNLLSLVSGSGSNTISWRYLYNSLNLIEKETLSLDGKSFVLDWNYNNLGAVNSLKYPSGKIINYAPNALGQPTKASEGNINYANNVKYHPNGQVKSFSYGNGITRNVTLDTTGRIDLINDVKASLIKMKLDPRYDVNDNLTGVVDWLDPSNDIDNISYDGVNRLRSADGKWGRGSYSYDGLGNIETRSISGSSITYHYNNFNRLNNLSGAYGYTYGHDTRGNVINNGRYGLAFNRANQVTTAKGIPYRYDGHNRRVKKNNDHSVYSQSGQLLARLTPSSGLTESIYLDNKLIAETTPTSVRYQHTDMLGTPVLETDRSGNTLTKSVYEPFGKRLGGEKAGIGYTGHLQDEDLGLTYMQARYYDPLIGRFYSNDPIGFRDVHSFNRYAYGNNNPYKYTDPDGKAAESWLNRPGGVSIQQHQDAYTGAAAIGVAVWTAGAASVSVTTSASIIALEVTAVATGDMPLSPFSRVNAVKLEKQLASQSQLTELAAGAGTVISQPAKQANRIASQTGFEAKNIQKVSSEAHVAKDGSQVQTHTFRDAESNTLIEPKTIINETN
ncbi:RHS repeat-associated core domain-containing protein [Shewanella sp. D64]|uniref:RHS repeat domain-containing protein n=1 Tax=unclassified Shewanella TaxID=196818 RepID=UPI0022BA4584|nr:MULTISPECIES: RHS repeat-associated core domain-containing protein [unclassified Shewanella]MEC4728928.1 RHS repeat-associated core domain-containing protein [Shewanella sp. D64]MEC4740875.1 RHS repeat-associated core domain-containing protein [Shewanella sp. E94]WBJ96702.1 RHS repeat-associated core domain-containing protein [Shewanella sp. MTB7]